MKHALIIALFAPLVSTAATVTINMYAVNDTGTTDSIGQVLVEDSHFGGVLLTPSLTGLTPGAHGFHLHDMPSCAPSKKEGHIMNAGAAGGHYDPGQTNSHAGPYGAGHLGDLPILVVNKEGKATTPTLAPRLKADDFQQHALMIHAGGDNYSDTPEALGGGGIRIACGVPTK